MPSYIVTLNDDTTPEQMEATKKQVRDQGGKIEHEYTIVKGFSVCYPEGSITTLEADKNVKSVELDKKVTTQ